MTYNLSLRMALYLGHLSKGVPGFVISPYLTILTLLLCSMFWAWGGAASQPDKETRFCCLFSFNLKAPGRYYDPLLHLCPFSSLV